MCREKERITTLIFESGQNKRQGENGHRYEFVKNKFIKCRVYHHLGTSISVHMSYMCSNSNCYYCSTTSKL